MASNAEKGEGRGAGGGEGAHEVEVEGGDVEVQHDFLDPFRTPFRDEEPHEVLEWLGLEARELVPKNRPLEFAEERRLEASVLEQPVNATKEVLLTLTEADSHSPIGRQTGGNG